MELNVRVEWTAEPVRSNCAPVDALEVVSFSSNLHRRAISKQLLNGNMYTMDNILYEHMVPFVIVLSISLPTVDWNANPCRREYRPIWSKNETFIY